MHQKTSGGVLQFAAASKDSGWLDAHAEARHVEDTWCLEGINRTWWSDGDRAWLAGTASYSMLVGLLSPLIFASLRETQLRTSPGEPADPACCWLSEAEAWLSLLGSVRAADPNSPELDCWCICEVFASGLTCCCLPMNWTADFLATQMGFAPKNHF